MKTSTKSTTGRILSLVLASLVFLVVPAVCESNAEALSIPDTYRNAVVINCFQDTWSVTEDGSDWVKSVSFASDTDEFITISDYLDGATLSDVDSAGNFTADFSFPDDSGGNGYDFKYLAEDELVLRDPAGECSRIDMDIDKLFSLKELIGEIRLGIFYEDNPIVGGYTGDRALSEEELVMFEAVLNDLIGAKYEPELVATQVVAGINYRFTATVTPVTPDAIPRPVYVYIFQPLEGEPELVSVEDIE